MNDRIMVRAYANEYGIDFRTVSQTQKSPRRFYVVRDVLDRLVQEPYIIVQDIYSFAVLRLDAYQDTLTIEFSWLESRGGALSGREETVVLPYGKLMEFVRASVQEDGPKTWRALSLDMSRRRPQLIFEARKTLHAIAENATIRHKLARCLNRHFQWPDTETIYFYADFVPYSFFFQETRRGQPGICGGVILHNQENMEKAYYSVHT